MKQNFLQGAKADGAVFFKTVGMVAKIGKLKVAIYNKQQERARLLKAIGGKMFDLYRRKKAPDSDMMLNAVAHDLEDTSRLEVEIEQLEIMMAQVRKDFKGDSNAV